MKLTELAGMLDTDLIINFVPGCGTWGCHLQGIETKANKGSAILTSTWGSGSTPAEAMRAYANELGGKQLVLVKDAMLETRREFMAPQIIEPE